MTTSRDPTTDGLLELLERGARLAGSTRDERADLLDRAAFGGRIAFDAERAFATYLRLVQLPVGAHLFREGDHDAFCAIVVTGALEIRKSSAGQHEHVVARLGVGKMVGEMSLVDGAPRSASAVAVTPTELLVLSRDAFERMSEEQPRVALRFALLIVQATANLVRQTTGALVDHLG